MKDTIVTNEDISRLLHQRQRTRQRFTVTCKNSHWNQLFTYKYPHKRLQVKSSDYWETLTAVFDRCGIVDLKCEYYPSTLSPSEGIKYDSLAYTGFDTWFRRTTETKREMFLDTNMIIHRTLSRVLLRRLSNPKELVRNIRIPRLVLLELEAKYNRAKEDLWRSKKAINSFEPKKTPHEKESQRQKALVRSLGENGREVRLMISAQIEVQLLKAMGAQTVFAPLSAELLEAYYSHAGRGFADPFIRKEILDSAGGGLPSQAVFLTRDLMNALTACAENLDTFYFSRASSDRGGYKVDDDQTADALIETAIDFEEARVDGLIPRKTVILKGMWETKSNIDWLNRRVLMTTS